MGFIASTGRILNFYYYFGLSPYRINLKTKQFHLNQWLTYVETCVTGICSSFLIWNAHKAVQRRQIPAMEELLITSVALIDLVRALMILNHSIFSHKQIQEVMRGFQIVESNLEKDFGQSIDYDSLRRKYTTKCYVVLFFFLLHRVIYFVRQFTHQDWSLVMIALPGLHTRLMQPLTVMYTVYYIDVSVCHMSHLNAVIAKHGDVDKFRRKLSKSDIETMLARLHSFKAIHFQLWNINNHCNAVFGWCWVVLIFHMINDMLYALYWSFDMLRLLANIFRVLLPIASFVVVLTEFVIFSQSCQAMTREVNNTINLL